MHATDAKHRLFEMGDKPGRLLARLAAGRRESKAISSLKDETRRNCYETNMLVEIMKNFYKKLYTSECTAALQKLDLLSLSEADKVTSGRPITDQEIIKTILYRGEKLLDQMDMVQNFIKHSGIH